MNLDGNFPTYEKQEAIKLAVDAIKTTSDITKTGVDNVYTKQDQLIQNLEAINTKIEKMDSAFEAGKFIPFQRSGSLGVTNWSSVYKVTGAGVLDLALIRGYSTTPAGIKIIVDGVTLVHTPETTNTAVGIVPNSDWTSSQGNYLQVHVTGNSVDTATTPNGTYTVSPTSGSQGILWIARPIKFNTSLDIQMLANTGANFRLQGGIFI